MESISGLFSNLFVASASLTLIHFVWQGALVAFMLRIALSIIPQSNSLVRYRTSIVFLLAIVILPVYTFSYLYQSPDVVTSTVKYSVDTISSIETISSDEQSRSADIQITDAVQNKGANLTKSELTPIARFVGSNNQQIMLNILWLWLAGFVFMAIKFVLDLTRTFGLTKNSVMPVDSRVKGIVLQFSKECELKRPVQILKSSIVNVPIVVGWLRPVILLPIAITIGLEKKQLELIIAHEMAHIKRTDFLVNLVQNLIQICFFYHPSVHWINRVIRDEREFICDSMALDMVGMSAEAKLNLAKALLNTEEMSDGNLSLMAVALSGGKLKERIAHILGTEYKPATSIKGLAIGFITFLFSFVAMASTMTFESNETNIASMQKSHIVPTELAVVSRRNKAVKANEEKTMGILLVESEKSVPVIEKLSIVKDHTVQVSNKKFTKENRELVDRTLQDSPMKVAKLTSAALTEKKLVKEDSKGLGLRKNAFIQTPKTILVKEGNKPKTRPVVRYEPGSKIKIAKIFLEPRQKFETPIKTLGSNSTKRQTIAKSASLDLSSIKQYSEPKAIFTPYPEYPRRAWNRMIDQTIKVDFNINEQGKVKNIKTIGRVDKDFAREIRRKLIKWRYEPAKNRGKIVQHKTSMEFVFEAPQKEKVILTTTGSRIRRL